MRELRLVLLLIALTAFLAAPAFAQTSYRLYGYVIDVSEVVVPGATVKVMKNGEVIATAVTDDCGRFSILVEPGTYTIVAEKTGFKPAQEVVEVKNHTSVTLVLAPVLSVEPVKKVFGPGDWLELKITGPADAAVTVVITNPKGINIFDQVTLPHSGSATVKMFKFPEKATQYCPEGEYKVTVTYNGISATATFKFSLQAPGAAVSVIELSPEVIAGKEGLPFRVTAELQGPSVEAWKVVLELSFDPNAIDLVKVATRPPLKASARSVEPGRIKVLVEGALRGGVVAFMDFKIKVGAEPSDYTIKLLSASIYDKEGNAIPVKIKRDEVKVSVKKGLAGDVTGDEVVDYKDLAVLAACFGAKKGTAKYKVDLDFNGDGVIDYRDLAVFAAVYGLRRGKP